MKLLYKDIIREQPEEYAYAINMHGACLDSTIVVLDDDPTGCQTVYNVPALFSWDTKLLEKLLSEKTHLFFILTNTRSMPEADAVNTVKEVMEALKKASDNTGREYTVISRSDSTLRGHYPAELHVIEKYLVGSEYMHCLVPAFFQGGRYTCNDVHYVKEGEYLIPASETPYAKDKVFGYKNSNLKKYIHEKSSGAIKPDDVFSFSVKELRELGTENVKRKLMDSESPVCIVNALAQSDLDVFAAGVWEAILRGKKILFRTAASFINSFGCIPLKETLRREEFKGRKDKGGLVIVGSNVPKTTNQLQNLIENSMAIPIELHVDRILSDYRNELISSIAHRANQLIESGNHALIYTSRELVAAGDSEENLEIGKRISSALVEIVSKIEITPSFIITKGGITSHDIAAKGLKMNIAHVIGQALPGVPVLVPEGNKEMKYIIFPGNVGNDDDLLNLFIKLTN